MLPFYLVFLASLIHHEVWRDEINAWAISYISQSLPEVLHRVHYEAHPAFWYVLLWLASRLSISLAMFKFVVAIIGTGIYFLLAWAALPLRRLELLLVLCSFYLTFEFTVMCRMYNLELLFALAYAWGRTRRPQAMLWNTLWLGLMANVDITGAILAAGLLIEYGLTLLFPTDPREPRFSRAAVVKTLGALGVFVLFFATSVLSLWPAKDIGWSTTGKMFSGFTDPSHILQACLKWASMPWMPLPINCISSWDFTSWPYLFLLPVCVLLLYLSLRDHWQQGIAMLSILLTGILFSNIVSVAGVRHVGVVYLGYIVLLWILRSAKVRVSFASYLLLTVPVVPGLIAYIDQWSWPYTDTQAAAAWIMQNHLENVPLFGTPDSNVVGVPERLHRSFYQLECQCRERIMVFRASRDSFIPERDMVPRLAAGFQKAHIPQGLFLITHRLMPYDLQDLGARGVHADSIAHFDSGFINDEYIYIYLLKPQTPVPEGQPDRH
ncbi:MAG: hypothetical protein PW792_06690 [Acidobacteriaceae bacterium]|nr:hypothetical protein [Acidobacteriaceae bacterium]